MISKLAKIMLSFFLLLSVCLCSGCYDGKVMDINKSDGCFVIQGGCYDGRYVYICLNDSKKDRNNQASADANTVILKINPISWEVVSQSKPLKLCHANDITYNSSTNELIVANNVPKANMVSIIDPNTLTIKSTATLSQKIASIAYSESENCYYAGISEKYDFVKLSSKFKIIGNAYNETEYDSANQSVEIYKDYLYFLRYNPNRIYVYSKDGTYKGYYQLDNTSLEPESIFVKNGRFYIAYYNKPDKNGGFIYRQSKISLEDLVF